MKKLKEGSNTSINCYRCSGEIMQVKDLLVMEFGCKCPHCGAMQIVKISKQYVIEVEKMYAKI